MMAGYYASLHSENVHKLVLYAPLYNFNDHTNRCNAAAAQPPRDRQRSTDGIRVAAASGVSARRRH